MGERGGGSKPAVPMSVVSEYTELPQANRPWNSRRPGDTCYMFFNCPPQPRVHTPFLCHLPFGPPFLSSGKGGAGGHISFCFCFLPCDDEAGRSVLSFGRGRR